MEDTVNLGGLPKRLAVKVLVQAQHDLIVGETYGIGVTLNTWRHAAKTPTVDQMRDHIANMKDRLVALSAMVTTLETLQAQQ